MKCTYGQRYRMDCNTCRCGHENRLLCTKRACLGSLSSELAGEVNDEEKIENLSNLREMKGKTIGKKKRVRKIIRREGKRYLRTDTVDFPELPVNKICTPGKIYQDGCKRCYCKASESVICSTENACKVTKVPRDLVPEDVRPPIKDKEFYNLPALSHTAAACIPGITYKVDCNVCICDENQDLICDKLMCISFADMHKAEAIKKSGLPCNSNNAENDVIQSKCVQCACNGTTYCEAKEGCVSEAEAFMRSTMTRRNSPFGFDYTVDKCQPDEIYKNDCNRCYCQSDQTLRCTQKACLSYSQLTMLKKEKEYLRAHGL